MPKSPPHLTHSLIRSSEARREAAPATAAPSTSRCDSTRRSPHSPSPVEILSRKSPEKPRALPQLTDLDRVTSFRPDDADEPGDAPGLPRPSASAVSLPRSARRRERWRRDMSPRRRRGLSPETLETATDLLRLRI